MKRTLAFIVLAIVTTLTGCGGGGGNSSATQYTVQQLTTRSGDTSSAAYITNDGRIFGESFQYKEYGLPTPYTHCAYVEWDSNGTQTVLRDGTDFIGIGAVNEEGVATSSGQYDPLLYNPATNTTIHLQCLEGGSLSGRTNFAYPEGMNSAGTIVGESGSHPAMWNSSGAVTALKGPSESVRGIAMGINSIGEIAGSIDGHAVVWNADGTIKTQYPDVEGFTAQALLINDQGYVVIGYWDIPEDLPMGLEFPENFTRVVIKTPSGGDVTLQNFGSNQLVVRDINALGQIVGYVISDQCQAVVWNPDGTGTILPLPTGCTGSMAYSINDSGTIVGRADGSAVIWKLK